MRALAGWLLVLSLAASPALAAGNGADNAGSTATNSSSGSDNSGNSATAKSDTASLESEISDLRDLIDSQAKQLDTQNDQLQQEQKKMQQLEQQLKATEAAKPATTSNVSATAPATATVTTASAAMPSVPAASSSTAAAPAPAAAQDNGQPPAPLFFRIGSATFTPLGFMDLTNVFRTPAIGSGIGTNFASVPYRIPTNFPNSGLTEDRFSAQNSRLGIRIDATVWGGQAIGYLETDFLGNAATSISITSNSYTLRMRVYFVDYTKGKIEILGGQDWSMLTPNRKGISPIPGDIFYSQNMDTNYQVGLVWERTPQFRFVYHAAKDAAFGISLENAEQYLGGGNGASNLPVTPSGIGGANAFNTAQFENGSNSNGTNIPNIMPDIIVKAAFDPMVSNRDFHFEVSGLLKEFRADTYFPPATGFSGGNSLTSKATGGAVSANANLELFKNFHLIANSYWSDGGGQKIFGTAPDVIIEPQANATSPYKIAPLHSGAGLGGAEWQVLPKLMIYGYYGGVYIDKDVIASATCTNGFCGYGVPAFGSGASANISTTEGQNRVIQEGTIGLIPIFWRSPNYGALQLITQYSYLSRNPWSVTPTAPKVAHAGMAWVDLRYVLP